MFMYSLLIYKFKKKSFFFILKCKYYIIMYYDYKEIYMGKILLVLLLCLYMYFCCIFDYKCMVIIVSKV